MLNLGKFGFYKVMLIVMISLVIGGCAIASNGSKASTQQLEEKVSHKMVERIQSLSQITVARAVKNESNIYAMGPKQHVLTGDKVEELKEMLLNDKNYVFDKTKKCLFVPEVAFSFQNSREVVLLVSLFCNQIKFVDGEKSVIVDYDPMAKEFNAFCREILDQMDKNKSKK